MNIIIPKDVQFIIDTFYKNGYEAFMVGGCVRDSLLNRNPQDFDITTSATPDITQSLFDKTIPTGIKHGTITVLINNIPYEVTTYRIEEEYKDNRRPDKVNFVTNVKEDLSRRDFTINAFAYNSKIGLKDYFQGIEDLNNKIIRTVGVASDRFTEDALRMLRAIRFSSQLNFSIEAKTYDAILNNYKLILNISIERITSEFTKILLSPNAYKGLSILDDTNILNLIIPDLTKYSFNDIDKLPLDLSTRLAFILINTDLPTSNKILKNLRFDNKTIEKSLLLIREFNELSFCKSKIHCKKVINKVGRENIYYLLHIYEVLNKYHNVQVIKSYIDSIINNNETLFIKELNIDGKILKNEIPNISGKEIGNTLTHLLNLVIEEKILNNASDLILEAKKYINK